MTISFEDSVATLLALGSYLVTVIGFLIAALGIWWSARAERRKQQAAFDQQRRMEAEQLLRMIGYADDVRTYDYSGRMGISTALQGLAATLLREHPKQLPTIIALREHLQDATGDDISWSSVKVWLDRTIAYLKGQPEPPFPRI